MNFKCVITGWCGSAVGTTQRRNGCLQVMHPLMKILKVLHNYTFTIILYLFTANKIYIQIINKISVFCKLTEIKLVVLGHSSHSSIYWSAIHVRLFSYGQCGPCIMCVLKMVCTCITHFSTLGGYVYLAVIQSPSVRSLSWPLELTDIVYLEHYIFRHQR